VGKEVPHSRKNVESRVKRNIKGNLLSHSKRPSTDGWRLNDENLSTSFALISMNPYEVEALMQFTASSSYNGLSSMADTLIDTAASLNFVSKDFVVT
jgi:hypothetical protein